MARCAYSHSIVNGRLALIGESGPSVAAGRADTDIFTVAGQHMRCIFLMTFSDEARAIAIGEAEALR